MTITLSDLTVSPGGAIICTVTATEAGTATLEIPIQLASVVLPVPIAVTLTPSSLTLLDNAPAGTLVATIGVMMSDGSVFSGTLNSATGGIAAVSGSSLELVRALTSAYDGPHQWDVFAAQNGAVATGSIAVDINPAGSSSFTVNGSATPAPAMAGTNITIAVTADPGGNYFRLLTPSGGEIQRTSPNTPRGASNWLLPLTEQNIFQGQSPVPPGVYTVEYDQGGANVPIPLGQIKITVT